MLLFATSGSMTFLNQKQVAQMLEVHRQTLLRWRSEHKGPPCLRIGKRYYYTREIIEQWKRSMSLAT